MLVLTRKKGESIVVPGLDLKFTLIDVGNGRVRIGITAPEHVRVHRHEVWQRIQEQGVEATRDEICASTDR